MKKSRNALKLIGFSSIILLNGCNVVPPLDCVMGAQRPGCQKNANGQYGYLFTTPITPAQTYSADELAASDDAVCKSYGAEYGTPEYVQCRENLANQRAANARGAVQAEAPLLMPRPAPAPAFPMMQTTPSYHSTCTTEGNFTSCNTQ